LLAYDVRYNSSVTISVDESLATAFSVLLPKARGPLTLDEREEARRLGEHLREALLTHDRVRRMANQSLAGHGLLNTFPYPMCLFDQDRFISFENDAAITEFNLETRLRNHGSRLSLTRAKCNHELTERLLALHVRGHGATAVVDMRESRADAPIWLHLSLLVPEAVMGVFGKQSQFLATLFDPQRVSALDPFALTTMFHLTPAEAKVAVKLAAGLTPEAVSIDNGTAISTVRSQISQIITKLGAQRTSEVVRILRQGEALWSCAGRLQQQL
jgi:DNA-binding CsgD family transcriptional regulator